MAFDFGTPQSAPSAPSAPSTPASSTGASKAPTGFNFGLEQGASASDVAPRCAHCGATMARTLVPANLPTHAPRPPEFSCPKCGYRTPY